MTKPLSLKYLFWRWFRLFLIWLAIVSSFAFCYSFALTELFGAPILFTLVSGMVIVALFEIFVWQRYTHESKHFGAFTDELYRRIEMRANRNKRKK